MKNKTVKLQYNYKVNFLFLVQNSMGQVGLKTNTAEITYQVEKKKKVVINY